MKRNLFTLSLILTLTTLGSNRIFAMRAKYVEYCEVLARAKVVPPTVFEVTNKSHSNLKLGYTNAQTGQLNFLNIAPKETHNIDDAKLVYDAPSVITITLNDQRYADLIKIVTCLSHKTNTTYPYTHVGLEVSELDYNHARKIDSFTGRLHDLRHIRVIIKDNKHSYYTPIRLERLYLY